MKKYSNGTKARIDGKGTFFGYEHRKALKSMFPMHDIDGIWIDSEDRVFAEYVTNEEMDYGIQLLGEGLRCCTIALFDYKNNRPFFNDPSESDSYQRNQAHYKYMCNCISKQQPLPCRFFHVYGAQYPMEIVEQNTKVFTLCDKNELSSFIINNRDEFKLTWMRLGLCGERHELKQHIMLKKSEEHRLQ